jgi:uncharacterized protein
MQPREEKWSTKQTVRGISICIGMLVVCTLHGQESFLPDPPNFAQALAASIQIDPKHVEVHRDVMIPMRDGVRLAADVYLPMGALASVVATRYPVILARTPYNKLYGETPRGWVKDALSHGYGVVVQDVRGTYASEGALRPLEEDDGAHHDGVDTLAWIIKQTWSDGRVGTTGMSYLGATQLQLAMSKPKGLVASFVEAPAVNKFTDIWYVDGAFALGSAFAWALDKAPDIAAHLPDAQRAAVADDLRAITKLGSPDNAYPMIQRLSLRDAPGVSRLPFWSEWLRNADSASSIDDVHNRVDGIAVPVFLLGGWYDLFLRNTYQVYTSLTTREKDPLVRANSRMLIGPWPHIPCESCNNLPGSRVNDAAYFIAWMDRWFKGTPNSIFDYPVILYVMGENRWRGENGWPLQGTQLTSYYLHSRVGANSTKGDGLLSPERASVEPPDHFAYDPSHPVPSVRGHVLYGGRADQSAVEQRDDVLIYSTEPLRRDVEVTGEIKASLYAASSATDTDWHVKLVDVYPDGKAYNLTSGLVRARYRRSRTVPAPLHPNEIENYEIDMWATSNVFKKGHRIRIEIASSDFPNFDLNPNRYVDLSGATEKDYVLARQTIYHDADHPSQIELPVIPPDRPRQWIATPFSTSSPAHGYVSVREAWGKRPPIDPSRVTPNPSP